MTMYSALLAVHVALVLMLTLATIPEQYEEAQGIEIHVLSALLCTVPSLRVLSKPCTLPACLLNGKFLTGLLQVLPLIHTAGESYFLVHI